MKKGRIILVSILLILMIGGFSLNAVAQDNSENNVTVLQTPEILKLNSSLNFEKEAIREWAKKYSWKEARRHAIKSHVRKSGESYADMKNVRLYTPLLSWVGSNYRGEQRFWSKEKIQEDYQSSLTKPNKGAYFLCQFMSTGRSSLDMENFRFVLEDEKGRHWEAGESGSISLRKVESRSVLGTAVYKGVIDLRFNFPKDKKPSWDELTLYIIRTDKFGRTEFTWDFK